MYLNGRVGRYQLLLDVKQAVSKGDALLDCLIGEVGQLCHTTRFFFVLCQPSCAQTNLRKAEDFEVCQYPPTVAPDVPPTVAPRYYANTHPLLLPDVTSIVSLVTLAPLVPYQMVCIISIVASVTICIQLLIPGLAPHALYPNFMLWSCRQGT